jgi:hypothetical protein
VIGHIRDNKCRDLMPAWSVGGGALDGPLRSLSTDGVHVRYARGLPGADAWREGAAQVVFTDGGMSHARPEAYELFDLKRRTAQAARAG